MVAVAQGYTAQHEDYVRKRIEAILGDKAATVHFICKPEMMGCYGAKMLGLREHESDFYLSVDDDMQCLPQTDFDRMLSVYRARKEIGCISGKYIWKPRMAEQIRVSDEIKYRGNAATEGGLLFSHELRDLFIKNQDKDGKNYYFDDFQWGLVSYLSGLVNAQYFGSWIIHEIGQSNAFRTFKKNKLGSYPDLTYTQYEIMETVKRGEIREVVVGTKKGWVSDRDYTEYARNIHNQNKRVRLI